MKAFITPSYTFTPGASGVGTVNLSGITSFNIKNLVAIINQTKGVVIYSTANTALKYTAVASTTVTLFFDTSAHANTDVLQVIYESTALDPLTDTQLRNSAVPVSLASVPLPTGAATDAKLDTLITKDYATSAKQDAHATLLGAVTETAPGTDTASSGLNGRLQRIAQRITSLIALFPTSLGQKTSANSFGVVIASDQVLNVAESALSITFQEILNLTTSAQTFTAPASAKWMLIETDDSNTANVRVKIGGTATTSSGIQFQPGRSEMIKGGGNISVIAESGTNQKISVQFGA